MDFDGVITLLNELLSAQQPETFSSSWILRNAPSCYHFIQRHIRAEFGGIDWDTVTYALEWKYQKRWYPGKKRKNIQLYEDQAEVEAALDRHRDKLYVFIAPIDVGELCALIAVDENDKIFWQFADGENYETWYACLVRFKPPGVVVADGEKGVAGFVKRYWPDTAFQRCHFHMVKLVIQYLSRNPREEAGTEILKLMYRLKYVKNHENKKQWLMFHTIWEKRFEKVFAEKNESGQYAHRKIRSVRFIVRRALPNLFTYLDFPGCPNTTNLVEGWVNAALAEALRRHRGLHIFQKKTLVSIILSHLTREKPTRTFPEKNTPIFP